MIVFEALGSIFQRHCVFHLDLQLRACALGCVRTLRVEQASAAPRNPPKHSSFDNIADRNQHLTLVQGPARAPATVRGICHLTTAEW